MTSTPTLAEVIENAVLSALDTVHVSMPGVIQKYDAEHQRCAVQPALKRGYIGENGERLTESLPLITDVPVLFFSAGGFRFTFPLKKGDTVTCLFSEGSLDSWLQGQGVVDSGDDRRHALTDAIVIPGLRQFSRPVKDASNSAMLLGVENGLSISIDPNEILLGTGAEEFVALVKDLRQLATMLDNWIVNPSDGGGALKVAWEALAATGWPFGASKVKAE